MHSESKEKGPIRTKIVTITALLVPPAQGLIARGRSLSNVSLRSLSGKPATSPTSTPNDTIDLSPRSSIDAKIPSFVDVMTIASSYIAPHDILTASMTTRLCHNLRTSHTFQNWLEFNGWDTGALVRRTDEAKGKTRWMHVAKSAIQKASLLERYHVLLEHVKSASKGKHHKKSIEEFMKILVDTVTEHETRNWRTLNALAGTLNMTFLQFVATIPAGDWKIRYQKTFLMTAYVNTQPLYPGIEKDVENVVKSIDFNDICISSARYSAYDNFLFTCACFAWTGLPPPLPSLDYDPPYHSLSFRSSLVPGLRQGAEQYKYSTLMKEAYRKANGGESKITMKFEPKVVSTSPAFQAAHDNSLSTYACFTWTDVPPLPLSSLDYDPPYHSFSSRSLSVPGLRQAAERYKSSMPMKGTYLKTNGDELKMTMQFEPKVNTKGLANKLSLPFTDKHLALTATVSDDEGNPSCGMEGSVNLETGRARGVLSERKYWEKTIWALLYYSGFDNPPKIFD
ncbi:hypothetical protein BU17DRAFT_92649 [Hysterangium stoloniferum]|nr:hypothetical protein BU17DRAFT_92649 [Hysterangium stoloniferum]